MALVPYVTMGLVMEFTTVSEKYYFSQQFSIAQLSVIVPLVNVGWAARMVFAYYLPATRGVMLALCLVNVVLWMATAVLINENASAVTITVIIALSECISSAIFVVLDGMSSRVGAGAIECYRTRIVCSTVGYFVGGYMYSYRGFYEVACAQSYLYMLFAASTDFIPIEPVGKKEGEIKRGGGKLFYAYTLFAATLPNAYIMIDYFSISALKISADKQSQIDAIAAVLSVLGTFSTQWVCVKHALLISYANLLIMAIVYRAGTGMWMLVAKSSMIAFANTAVESYTMVYAFDEAEDGYTIAKYTTLPTLVSGVSYGATFALTYLFEIDHDNFRLAVPFAATCSLVNAPLLVLSAFTV